MVHGCLRTGCALLLLLVGSHGASAQLADLITKTPRTSNVVVVVNVDAVLSSPMAVQGKWREKLGQAGSTGMISAPLAAEWVLMAAEMDYEFMHPAWEIGLALMPDRVSMKDIAARTGGRLDKFAGAQAVERPNDSYVVGFTPRIIGARSPANRQSVIRWVRESKAKKQPDLSAYLAEAVAVANAPDNQIVLAFELEGLFAPAEFAAALDDSQALADAKLDPKAAAEQLATILGLRLEVKIDAVPHARLYLSFPEDPSALTTIASPLLREILAERGAKIKELSGWTAKTQGNAILLEGQLSASGLRRVLSFLSSPVGPWASASGGASSPEYQQAEITRAYFQTVIGYLNDLFGESGVQPGNLDQVEIWVNRYAQNIHELDVTGVDPDAVQFADQVTAGLQQIGSTISYAEQRANQREANYSNYGRSRYGRYGAYGYFQKADVTRDLTLIQADEALQGAGDSQAVVDQLRTLSAQTRELLTERYNMQF